MKKILVKQVVQKPTRVDVTNRTCTMCRDRFMYTNNGTNYNNGRVDNNVCATCQFWVDVAMEDIRRSDSIIIDRTHYRTNNTGMFDFGGQVFEIQFADGRKITTKLASQGAIPIAFNYVPIFADNAEFVGAK